MKIELRTGEFYSESRKEQIIGYTGKPIESGEYIVLKRNISDPNYTFQLFNSVKFKGLTIYTFIYIGILDEDKGVIFSSDGQEILENNEFDKEDLKFIN